MTDDYNPKIDPIVLADSSTKDYNEIAYDLTKSGEALFDYLKAEFRWNTDSVNNLYSTLHTQIVEKRASMAIDASLGNNTAELKRQRARGDDDYMFIEVKALEVLYDLVKEDTNAKEFIDAFDKYKELPMLKLVVESEGLSRLDTDLKLDYVASLKEKFPELQISINSSTEEVLEAVDIEIGRIWPSVIVSLDEFRNNSEIANNTINYLIDLRIAMETFDLAVYDLMDENEDNKMLK